MTKIQPRLVQRVRAMNLERPDDVIPVVVTVRPGVEMAAIEGRGLKVERVIESISAVAGTVSAGDIEDLAALDEVQAIEYDGEIRTLSVGHDVPCAGSAPRPLLG